MKKWSNHCKDVCPHCQRHTELFANTYQFNHVYATCPHCEKLMQSKFDGEDFIWG